MSNSSVTRLPDELLLYILEHLDSAPPSVVKDGEEPTLHLTASAEQPLKAVSWVSRRWRRVVLPLLFKHCRLSLDAQEQNEWACCTENLAENDIPTNVQHYHLDMVEAFKTKRASRESDDRSPNYNTSLEDMEVPDEAVTAKWAWRTYHDLQPFCDFIQTNRLAPIVRSFVLLADRTEPGKHGRFPRELQTGDWRYPGSAAMWQHLFSIIDPRRVTIVAPPSELLCLTSANIDIIEDWTYGDMGFNLLELQRELAGISNLSNSVCYTNLQSFTDYTGFAPSSLLHLRDWSRLSLHEGSFLTAWGSWEFFERGPPGAVHSIMHDLSRYPLRPMASDWSLPALRVLKYTAIFPMKVDPAILLSRFKELEELDIQLAPNPQSAILDDKRRVGKVQLHECWNEVIRTYRLLHLVEAEQFTSRRRSSKLKKLSCRDFRIPMLREDLAEPFLQGLISPEGLVSKWREVESGVFERSSEIAESPG